MLTGDFKSKAFIFANYKQKKIEGKKPLWDNVKVKNNTHPDLNSESIKYFYLTLNITRKKNRESNNHYTFYIHILMYVNIYQKNKNIFSF